ncbi:MAG: glycosyltransferase family 4 protein [Lysobacteraceae bacterium]
MIRTPSGVAAAIAVFACGIAASAVLTEAARRYALRRQLLDHPGQRRSHVVPTPRGGGIGPVMVLLAGGALLIAHGGTANTAFLACLLGIAAIAGIGWFDDHRPLPAMLRLLVHLLAAFAAAITMIGTPHDPMQLAWITIATLGIAGLVNAWNFMDGIDGLATSQAGLVTLVVLVGSCIGGNWLDDAWWIFGLLLLAAIIGFLPFNFPRARIFLGDVGSGTLGFAIACLLLQATMTGGLSWPLAMLPVSAFLIDAGMTLSLRVVRGKAWWLPHREHLYQWMVRSGRSHVSVTGWYAFWSLCAGAIAIGISVFSRRFEDEIAGGTILCGIGIWMWLRKRIWKAARHRR